jgi:hypothetical protein
MKDLENQWRFEMAKAKTKKATKKATLDKNTNLAKTRASKNARVKKVKNALVNAPKHDPIVPETVPQQGGIWNAFTNLFKKGK